MPLILTTPLLPALERGRWFQFLEPHHRIHHVRMDRNLSVLLPAADFVLGAWVTQMPHTSSTPEAARRFGPTS